MSAATPVTTSSTSSERTGPTSPSSQPKSTQAQRPNPFLKEKILVHGAPKVGKTTLCASFPRPVFLATEPAHKAVEIPVGRALVEKIDYGPNGWVQFLSMVRKPTKKMEQCTTLIIDTIDNLYDACFEWTCKDKKMDHPSDLDRGKGWNYISREWSGALGLLVNFCRERTLMVVSHSEEKTIKTKVMEYTRYEPSLRGGRCADLILGLVDYTWYYAVQNAKGSTWEEPVIEHALYCQGTESLLAGDRYGRLPPVIQPVPKDQIYETICAAHDRSTQ